MLAAAPGQAAGGSGRLDLYEGTVDATQLQTIQEGGYDVALVEDTASGFHVEVVLTTEERNGLRKQGVSLKPVKNKKGQTVGQQAAIQAENGFAVYDQYDGPGGIEAQLRSIAKKNPQLVRLFELGTTHQGRPILGIRLTQGGNSQQISNRPAVLYQGTTHAREWISTEVTMRLLRWYLSQFPKNKTVHNLLKSTQLWFVPVVNPDGYQYSFDTERLWRKNLRDNDGDNAITGNDGVDLNRNYPEHWNFDNEGSNSDITSQTYRGPAPASEPEVQASIALFEMLPTLRFAISYHSFGQLLLYTQGWQVQTPSADDPIYVALTGTDDDPAVEDFDPGVGADLYTTNGEFTDWAHAERGVLAWTPELSEGCDGCGFVFPDDEALIQAEFVRNRPFALNVALSAGDPDDPVSDAGIDTADFYLDVASIDPWKAHNPASDLAVDVSYAGGSGQPVEILAKRSLGPVTLHYSINGTDGSAPATEAAPGERFGGNNAYNTYYHYLRGTIPGLSVGDEVEYWFTAGDASSDTTTFEVVEDADAEVLVLAAEDRTGASTLPGYGSTDPNVPNYLSFYTDALTAAGRTFDVYDVDAMGREAPDHLGVLSHYDAVLWYSGNDLVTREPGWTAGNASRLANDLQLEVRAYLNEGGKLLHTGQWAGALVSGVAGTQLFDPVANQRCLGGPAPVTDRCQVISDKDDFLQYYLGALIYNSDGGTDPDTGEPFELDGVATPYTGGSWTFNGADSAQNHLHTASFLTTSSLLDEATYPQFAGEAPAVWDTGAAGAFEPIDGSWYMYSGRADVTYKRLMRTIDLSGVAPADNPTLSFRTSYDTEPGWDFVFVEAHTVGEDDWTTLPDANNHTSTDTGESCPSGWIEELHPWLERYQGLDCSGVGTTGTWNAASGRSAGWEEWEVDLSPYAGDQVEVSISYASDWGVQGLGAFVDAIQVSHGGGSTSFETGMDGWTTPGAPEGSAANPNDWLRTMSVGFEEGGVVTTADTLYFGFGLEGVTGAAARSDLADRSLDHLLGP